MKLTFVRRIVVGAALLLASASLAAADTVEYFADIFLPEGQQQSIDQSFPFFPVTVPLQKFDTTTGDTLVSVQIRLQYAFTGEIEIYNFNLTDQPHFGATATIPLTVTAQTGLGVFDPTVSVTPSVSIGGSATTQPTTSYSPTGVGETAGVYGQNIPKAKQNNPAKSCPQQCDAGYLLYEGLTGSGDVSSAPTSLASVLAAFSYLGGKKESKSVDALLEAKDTNGKPANYTGSAAPKVGFSGNATVGGKISVIYTYLNNPDIIITPEPMTMMLVGSAVLGLGVLMRRRGKAKI